MAKIQRRDGEQWQTIIAAQKGSGLTARAFCEKHAIGLASFYNWRKRLVGGPVRPGRSAIASSSS